jgi:hypothetical protein
MYGRRIFHSTLPGIVVPVGNSNSTILMVWPAQDRRRTHAPCSAHITPNRRALCTDRCVVVFLVRCENVAKVALTNDDNVIKTFPSDRADQVS